MVRSAPEPLAQALDMRGRLQACLLGAAVAAVAAKIKIEVVSDEAQP